MASTTTLVTDSQPDLNQQNGKTKENTPKSFEEMTVLEKVRVIPSYITAEPIMACYVMASVLCGPALNTLMIEKSCRVNLAYNDSTCDDIIAGQIQNLSKENTQVQEVIANMQTWQSPVQSVMPLILVLFLGSYSDRCRLRKPFMLLPLIGEFFSVAACILCVVYMKEWPIEALGVSQTVIPSFFGGQTMLVMAVFSFIADITSIETRTLRVGMLQITINLFVLIAQPLGGIYFQTVGYIGVLSTACAIFFIALIYGIFRIKEPREPKNVFEHGVKGCFLDAFNPSHAIDTFGLLIKKKEGTNRALVLMIMLIMFLHAGVVVGEVMVFFLYALTAYEWTPVVLSYYFTASTALYLFGATVALPLFTRVLKLEDSLIMVIAFLDKIAAMVILAFASNTTWLYISTVVGIIQREGLIGIRSTVTKVVAEDDLGKAQSLFGIMEAAAPALLGPAFNQMYIYTQETFLGATFLLGAGLFGVATLIAMYMYIFNKKHKAPSTDKTAKVAPTTDVKLAPDMEMTHI